MVLRGLGKRSWDTRPDGNAYYELNVRDLQAYIWMALVYMGLALMVYFWELAMYSALDCIDVNWYAWFRVLHVLIQGAFLCLDIRA